MRHHNPLSRAVLAVSAVLLLTTPAAAQEVSANWSRILHPMACHPDTPCQPREGLLWDSTNVVPRFPGVMRAVGIGGEAVLTFRVGTDGAVDPNSVAVLRTSNQAFAAGSADAVRGWRFGTELAQRPTEPVTVELHLIFSHEGACTSDRSPQHTGWAATNQLVTGTCVRQMPRSS